MKAFPHPNARPRAGEGQRPTPWLQTLRIEGAHPHPTKLEAVGASPPVDDLAERVGQRRDLAEPGGHARQAALVEAEAVEGGGVEPGGQGADEGGRDRRRGIRGPATSGPWIIKTV